MKQSLNACTKDAMLQHIARHLVLHASTRDIGLLNGKTGISLFFYHYARYSGKKIYDDFAGELVDDVYKEIHKEIPLGFADGLCGIAYGIEYLIRNRFVEANPDEVLEELDKRIVEWDVRRITDYSLKTGLKGIACYVISRRENRNSRNPYLTSEYCSDLIHSLKQIEKKDKETVLLIENLRCVINNEKTTALYSPIFNIIDKVKYNAKTFFDATKPKGIDKSGHAGIGLHIMKINKIG
jgi:hypothetical protein